MMYGICPKCGQEVVGRERRPNGNDVCAGGHTYPSYETLPQHTHDRIAELTIHLNLNEITYDY